VAAVGLALSESLWSLQSAVTQENEVKKERLMSVGRTGTERKECTKERKRERKRKKLAGKRTYVMIMMMMIMRKKAMEWAETGCLLA
jgi:hypothetical protein